MLTKRTQGCVGASRPARVMEAIHNAKGFVMQFVKPVLVLALLAPLATPAAALEPLAKEKYINDRLIAARIADRVRRTCPTIDGRIFHAYSEARRLERYARDKGYSKAQIDAFLDDKDEKARIYGVAEEYLKRHGAKSGDAESFCKVGQQEIQNRTIIGSLLVAK